MENNKDYYCTYQFYDEKGRRLSIFSRLKGERMEILVFTCSKKDTFSKKKARDLYNEFGGEKTEYSSKPKFVYIPIENDKPKFTFLKWCRENFYQKHKFVNIFVKADGQAIIPIKQRMTLGEDKITFETQILFKK